jgi:hypothetical protein
MTKAAQLTDDDHGREWWEPLQVAELHSQVMLATATKQPGRFGRRLHALGVQESFEKG